MKFKNIEKKENKGPQNKDGLKIITIGGTEKVNKNLTVYEYKDDIIVVDCGIGFPDIFEMPGVDALLPDFTYLLENSEKIKGVFITHGHEDHVGAVPNLLEQLPDLPIYGSKLIGEFLKVKLSEKRFKTIGESFSFHLIEPDSKPVTLGNFEISSIGVNHSIPEAQGFAIRTPEGLILHIAEYKFDETPIVDKPIEVEKIKKFADEGVTCLLSDCLLVTAKGSTKSEESLSNTFFELFERAGKRQILVTTISSNISRMNQITAAAVKYGRKVVPSGRSIEQMVRIARSLGYLPNNDDVFISEQEAINYLPEDLVYIIAGCYGQPGSSLGRLSRDEHESISLEKDAMLIFSGDPAPPGSDIMVEKIQDAFNLKGIEVIYGEIQGDLHVSGHGTHDDLKRMAKLVHPKYFVPLGGSITKMRNYTNMLNSELDIDKKRVFESLEGDSVIISNGKARKGPHYNVSHVFMEQGAKEALNPAVVRDRSIISDDGLFIVVVPVNGNDAIMTDKIEVITRGFIYVKDSREFLDKSKKYIRKTISKRQQGKKDTSDMRRRIESDIRHYLRRETRMHPMVIVHFLKV